MKRCSNCLMAATKPGVSLNKDDVCQACKHKARRGEIDYDERREKLREIADTYRRDDGYYDCLIPVSGGKDSHFQTYVMSEELDMNPLLLAVADSYGRTDAGEHNLENLRDAFDCDLLTMRMGLQTEQKMTRIAFEDEELAYPVWPTERAIQCVPLQVAIQMDIPLVVYGENVSWEYGGTLDHEAEPYSAMGMIENGVAEPIDFDFWYDRGLSNRDLNMIQYPPMEDVKQAGLEPIFLSYFYPWDGYANYQKAKKFGFRDLSNEWDRDGYIDEYDQIDAIGYLLNYFLKYAKLGFGRTTDVVGYWRRSDHVDLTLEEGKELIQKHDHELDQRILDDFLEFTGYDDREFWTIVEKHKNEELFEGSFEDGPIPKPNRDFENLDL